MNIAQLKELTKNYNYNSLVYVSYMAESYVLENPTEARTKCDYSASDGGIISPLWNSKRPTLLLGQLTDLDDSVSPSIDVEDGFIFRPIKKVLSFDGYIVLIPK